MTKQISRRAALKLSSGALLAAGLWPGVLKAAGLNQGGRFRFIAVNDLHYMTPECGDWLYFVMAQMKRLPNVDFALVCGDLTEHGEQKHLSAVKGLLRELPCPSYVQIGNHDYDKSGKRQGYEKVFPRRLNYMFNHEGWQLIGLDTTDGLKYENTQIQEQTFQWVRDNRIKWNKTKPTILFTHFPLGMDVKYRPSNADAFLDLFREFNLVSVFSGHYHSLTHKINGSTEFWTNRCCALKRNNHDGTKEKGYLLCEAANGKVTTRFFDVV